MFDFANDRTEDKGLFTFYREQAEIDEQNAAEKKKRKQNIQNITLKESSNRSEDDDKLKHKISSEDDLNKTEKIISKKSFHQLNKDFVRKLSLKNETSFDLSKKEFGSEVVVIKRMKSSKQKEDLKLQKLNLRYQMQDGHFIKEKIFDPLEESLLDLNEHMEMSERTREEFLPKKRRMKRNQSLNDKYQTHKNELENELIVSKEAKEKNNGITTPRLESIRRVDVQSELLEQESSVNFIQSHKIYHPVHKRIPPKVLASIIKNENHELIKHLRKELEKEREEETRNSMNHRNHSFIEYGSHDYEKSGLDSGRLNEKQRRLITILNKFHKKPFTKVFIN